jgi:hypothetical protein
VTTWFNTEQNAITAVQQRDQALFTADETQAVQLANAYGSHCCAS